MNFEPGSLAIHLHETPVASLTPRVSAEGTRRYELQFHAAYVQATPRPVLSLAYRDWDLSRPRSFVSQLPPLLSNLLPERGGPLRAHITRAAGLEPDDDYALLAFVGGDLSGAVRVAPAGTPADVGLVQVRQVMPGLGAEGSERLRFSLAGVQLKFSVDRTDRMNLAVVGRGGRWILKLASPQHPHLARAELTAMSWARHVGFEVPSLQIVDPTTVDRLPDVGQAGTQEALLVRRFDRPEAGGRLHMEEMTSVLSLQPESKYARGGAQQGYGLVALGRLIKALAGREHGPAELRTFFRRVLFDVMAGNGDAHLKNWAFVFPDSLHPKLAPVYDVVPTVLYIDQETLALPFVGGSAFGAVDVGAVRAFARKLNEDPDDFVALARELVCAAADTFEAAVREGGLPTPMADRLRSHWQSLPLLSLP